MLQSYSYPSTIYSAFFENVVQKSFSKFVFIAWKKELNYTLQCSLTKLWKWTDNVQKSKEKVKYGGCESIQGHLFLFCIFVITLEGIFHFATLSPKLLSRVETFGMEFSVQTQSYSPMRVCMDTRGHDYGLQIL